MVKDSSPNAEPYFQNRILPLLKQKVFEPLRLSGGPWTNNNDKSINFSLKCITNWKLLKAPQLLQELEKAVTSLYQDIIKSITDCGPYKLSAHFSRFHVAPYRWKSWSTKETEKQIERFFEAPVRPTNTSCTSSGKTEMSTDGRLLATAIPSTAGKKIGQRKRSRSNRSFVVTKSGKTSKTQEDRYIIIHIR